MTRVRVETPSRLHFGLLAWGPDAPRQFGGVGLMVESPGLLLTAEPSERWAAEGPLAERALSVAQRIAGEPVRIRVHRAPPEHVGLGVGTQLSLAVTRAVLALTGELRPPAE